MLIYEWDNQYSRTFSFLKANDGEFIPALSSRVEINHYAEKLTKYGCNLFVRDGVQDVGFAGFYANDRERSIAFISSICVMRQHQESSVACRLLERIISCAASKGMNILLLEVDENNGRAIAFYRKHGFQFSAPQKDKRLYMKLHLSS